MTDRWAVRVLLGDNTRLADGLASAEHSHTHIHTLFILDTNCQRSTATPQRRGRKGLKILPDSRVDVFIPSLGDDDVSGLGRCAILFFSPEKPGLELDEVAPVLTAAAS